MSDAFAAYPPQHLAGKVAIITGASTGLGAVMAKTMVRAGAKVVGVARTQSNLDKVAAELEAMGHKGAFLPVAGDVSRRASCEAAVQRALDAFGTIDILVNNAGVGSNHARPKDFQGTLHFWECDPDLWDEAVAINNASGYYMARLAVLPMLKKGWGRIINNTTNFHTMLGPGRACYGPGKAGLEASSLIWSKELEGSGVTVNVLIPGGPTATPIHEKSRGIPLEKMMQPDIFEAPTLWLASTASDGVSGFRFNAKLWDRSLPPAEAALRARQPAAWDSLSVGKAHIPQYVG
ncbi:MAG TPA: SDR family NAD(P)-dependent oxidoreductase [Alphaproteobacteria bacterium]|jgi:3-oxoacyl-[acyl-carrier protein] reductase